MTEIVKYQNLDELQRMAKLLAASGYFEAKGNSEMAIAQAATKILAGQEMGYGPFASMNGIHIIQGNPTTSANLMAAAVKAHPKYDYRVRTMSDKEVSIEYFQNGESIGTSSFTIDEAKKAGTKNLDKFPRNMLFARAMSNGVRWFCPDVFNGNAVYTPEEFGDTETFANEITVLPPETPQNATERTQHRKPTQHTNTHRNGVPAQPASVQDEIDSITVADSEPLSFDGDNPFHDFTWPTDEEVLDICAGLYNSPDCPKRVVDMIQWFSGQNEDSDKPLSEKQYPFMVSLVDERYGKGSHNAILSALISGIVNKQNVPGWKTKVLIAWLKAPEENAGKLEVLDALVAALKQDLQSFEVA